MAWWCHREARRGTSRARSRRWSRGRLVTQAWLPSTSRGAGVQKQKEVFIKCALWLPKPDSPLHMWRLRVVLRALLWVLSYLLSRTLIRSISIYSWGGWIWKWLGKWLWGRREPELKSRKGPRTVFPSNKFGYIIRTLNIYQVMCWVWRSTDEKTCFLIINIQTGKKNEFHFFFSLLWLVKRLKGWVVPKWWK